MAVEQQLSLEVGGEIGGVAILSKEQDGATWTERAYTIKVIDA